MWNTAQILRAAARRVRRGWCQHEMSDEHGNVCAIGGIARYVETTTADDILARRTLIRALDLNGGSGFAAIPHWNDAPGQTAENVAAGLEYAALFWEEEQKELSGGRNLDGVTVSEACT